MNARGAVRAHPRWVTAATSVVGYALVIGTFAGVVPIFPEISRETVLLFSDLIAVINTCALSALLVGYYCIRQGKVRAHRAAMLTAFALIMAFLVVYLWKVGGGFEKRIVIEQGQFLWQYADIVHGAYIAMLAIHILLSVVSVPVVLHAVVLGLTHDPDELPSTSHPTVGKIAVASWTLSLALGVVTYWMLNHMYSWTPMVR